MEQSSSDEYESSASEEENTTQMNGKKHQQEEYESSSDESMDEEEEDGNTNLQREEQGQVGILEQIVLVNFMCHKNLQVDLGPNINFIVGQNGSGKSAILVALTVCLGAKAGFTHRGNKLTDLIRTGSTFATITVKIRNRGPEAYRPDVYGKSIVIERRIVRDGASSYKLKDHTGKKVIANSFNELSLIMEQFNIQINNPCCILMQDTSREFLTNASTKQKYKFFLMATQLQQMEEDFITINEQMEILKSMINKKKRLLPDMETTLNQYKQEYQEMHALQDLEEKIEQYRNMMAWAHVEEIEKSVRKAEDELKRIEEEIENFQQKDADMNTEIEELRAEVDNKNALLADFSKKLGNIRDERQKIESAMGSIRKELMEKQANLKDASKRHQNIINRAKKLEQSIEQERKKMQSDNREEIERRQSELKRKREELDIIAAEHSQNKKAKIDNERKLSELSGQLESQRSEERRHANKLESLKKEIQEIQNQKNNQLTVFGSTIPLLLKKLDQKRGDFQKFPVGPCGRYIKLKDSKWASAVEVCLTPREICSFLVDNEDHDRKKFVSIARAEKCQVPPLNVVKIGKGKYSIPPGKLPDRHFKTVLDVVDIENEAVFRHLIDSRNVERKIMIEDPEEARNVMFTENPRNVKECYTINGDRVFVSNGATNFISNRQRTRNFIGVDISEKLRNYEENYHKEKSEYETVVASRKESETILSKMKRDLYQIQRTLDKQQMDMQNIEHDIKDLENFRVEEEESEDISELESNLKRRQEEIEELSLKCEEAKRKVEEVQEKKKPLEIELKQKIKEIEKIELENNHMTENAKKAGLKLQSALDKQELHRSLIQNAEKNISSKQADIEELKKRCDEAADKASQISSRVQVTMNLSQLEKQVGALERRLQKERQGRKKSLEEVRQQYESAKRKFKEINTSISKLDEFLERLQQNLTSRVKKWGMIRKSLSKRTDLLFNSHLSQKGYTGSLKFDHKKKSLEVTVQLEKMGSSQQSVATDTRTLSGGERSYSTVSLLLALWEVMENPFRAMDEFDVFMDSVNRQISIELLVNAARTHKQRQFIFITPHDYSSIKGGSDIRICKMRPPERGQATLTQTEQ